MITSLWNALLQKKRIQSSSRASAKPLSYHHSLHQYFPLYHLFCTCFFVFPLQKKKNFYLLLIEFFNVEH